MTELTVRDLQDFGGEPRILDLVVAERLGFAERFRAAQHVPRDGIRLGFRRPGGSPCGALHAGALLLGRAAARNQRDHALWGPMRVRTAVLRAALVEAPAGQEARRHQRPARDCPECWVSNAVVASEKRLSRVHAFIELAEQANRPRVPAIATALG